MSEPHPTFINRLLLAFSAFWRALAEPGFAERIARLNKGPSVEPQHSPGATALKEPAPDAALQLLGLLQQEGRLIDFLEEDVSAFSDADIGGAARVVHEGCRRALREHLTLEPVRGESEGARLTVAEGFDAGTLRLTGNVVGQAPFTGTLRHHGWRVADVRLPKLAQGHDVRILAPAEVEL